MKCSYFFISSVDSILFSFLLARKQNKPDNIPPAIKQRDVECKRLPIPTRGVQILPARKVREPITAEAAPALSLSASIARAVAAGNIKPMQSNMSIRVTSNQMNDMSKKRQRAVAKAKVNIPKLPVIMLNLGCLNFIDSMAPTAIATEFTPKQRLNTKGEKP